MDLWEHLPPPSGPHGTAALRLYCCEQRSGHGFRPGVALAVNAGFEECFRRNLASE